MHLTNYAVNKHSRMYVIDDEIGSKRSAFASYFTYYFDRVYITPLERSTF